MRRLRRPALILAAALGIAVAGVTPAQAAGFSFYQGCGGAGQGVNAYMASGAVIRIPCGTGLSGGVVQVGNPYYAERVYQGGSSVCVLPGQRVTIRSTGASGRAQYRCP